MSGASFSSSFGVFPLPGSASSKDQYAGSYFSEFTSERTYENITLWNIRGFRYDLEKRNGRLWACIPIISQVAGIVRIVRTLQGKSPYTDYINDPTLREGKHISKAGHIVRGITEILYVAWVIDLIVTLGRFIKASLSTREFQFSD